MEIVFGNARAVVGPHLVSPGEVWWAGDPVVVGNPSLFTRDPRRFLRASVPVPAEVLDEVEVSDVGSPPSGARRRPRAVEEVAR